MIAEVKENKFFSFNNKPLCDGCKLCVKGQKTVVYITGVCPRHCFYCPLSEQKKDNDVMYANERKVTEFDEIIEEIKLCKSKGVGITGGDPLARFERTLQLITLLKKEFGIDFHIHLYTSLDLLSKEKLSRLECAGLDEIRVHPDLYEDKKWDKLLLLNEFKKAKGIEIPAIPNRDEMIKDLLQYAKDIVHFVNLNEFEYSDMNEDDLHEKGFYCRDATTYAIEDSREMALKIIQWSKQNINLQKLPIHFCTAKLKDATQIANRLKLRAKSVKQTYDLMTEDGMLIRGVIQTKDQNRIKEIKEEFDIPKSLITFDLERNQILVAPWVLNDIHQDIKEICQIVTEYPTYDRMIVEVEEL